MYITYRCRVILRTKQYGGEVLQCLEWTGNNLERFVRWKWYYRYRAALLQTQNPKMYVEIDHTPVKNNSQKDVVEILKRRVSARKSQLSKWKNLLKKAEENWNQLFPIQEDPNYKKSISKIKYNQGELNQVMKQLEKEKSKLINHCNG